jgi:Ca2+-binding EF-hand superfamily protein
VHLPRKHVPQYQRTSAQIDTDQIDKPLQRTRSDGCKYGTQNPTKKSAKYGSKHTSLFDKDEKLVGMHVKKNDLKKGETKVVYSQLYLHEKKLDPEDVENKGTGTVIDWDPDGMMTDVRWENGETEYCCTGFNRLYYLALKIVVDEDGGKTCQGWEDPGKKLMSKMVSYPDWDIEDKDEVLEGVSRMRVRGQFRVYTDVWDVLHHQHQLRKLIKDAKKQGKDTHTLDYAMQVSHKTMANLELDQALMSSWIVSKINDVEIRIPPSDLAPPGPGLVICNSHKRPSLLDDIEKQVRRDTEKARRQAKLEAEAERERIRLERKAFRCAKRDPNSDKAKQLRELAAKNKQKQSRLQLEPLEAALSANVQELDELLSDTFSLFDADNSNSLDLVEFEQAIQGMGIKGQSDNLQALVKAMDSDGNGTLDVSEFKLLAKQMVEIAREAKTDVDKKKELQMLNLRRKVSSADV